MFWSKIKEIGFSVVLNTVFNVKYLRDGVTEWFSEYLGEAIWKSFLNNLVSLGLFAFGLIVVLLFPSSKIALLIFSILMLIVLIRLIVKCVIGVRNLMIFIKEHGFMIKPIVSLVQRRWRDALLWLGNLILLILPSVVLFVGYVVGVNFVLKPILIDKIVHMDTWQVYIYPVLSSIDLIFKTNTLAWIGF